MGSLAMDPDMKQCLYKNNVKAVAAILLALFYAKMEKNVVFKIVLSSCLTVNYLNAL